MKQTMKYTGFTTDESSLLKILKNANSFEVISRNGLIRNTSGNFLSQTAYNKRIENFIQ